ncbi:DMT family transporter [Antarcticirhabdus aurantiaca]|uniref:DMT family transporter n=1 Tax=Antarcticirhabdus aurantiaca TaxID=2606717 RepID=A0ACD4NSU4_9HYPH|nr:DMT family transporter [Antarcticirhabdus aurantiaca]WAJ29735.1 DMT family transporter [Jeongeuplla avenae]
MSEALALASALCLAVGTMLIGELKGRISLLQLARWQMVATLAMTGTLSVAVGGWRGLEAWQVGFLAASSLFGIMIATTTYFAAIDAVGPRMTALLFSLTAPFALVLGYVALGETISGPQGLGIALVLLGVVLAIGVPRRFLKRGSAAPPMPAVAPATLPLAVPPAPPVTGPPWRGIALGTVTAFGQALGSLFARPAMAAGVEPFTAMAVRSGLAALFFLALLALPIGRAGAARLSPGAMGLAVASAFVGTTLGMSLLMAALTTGDVGVVSTLASTTPVLILPLVWLREKRRPPAPAWAGAVLAIAGTALIGLG